MQDSSLICCINFLHFNFLVPSFSPFSTSFFLKSFQLLCVQLRCHVRFPITLELAHCFNCEVKPKIRLLHLYFCLIN